MAISVLMSVYYREQGQFLKDSLTSIVNQSYPPDEIVLVKDGPLTEDLEFIIRNFCDAYPKLFNIIQLEKNMGLGSALRIGALKCKFEFIARMDTDDVARRHRFETQADFLVKNPEIGVVGSNIEEFNLVPGDLGRMKINPETHDELIRQIGLRSPFNHPSIMMRRESLIESGNYNGELLLFEDYSLFLRMWKNGVKFYNIQEVLLDFRVGDGIQTIKRRSGIHYLRKERDFLRYAKEIGAYNNFDILRYKILKFPIRLLPPRLVLLIYNSILRRNKRKS